jgi:TPR repeat protein
MKTRGGWGASARLSSGGSVFRPHGGEATLLAPGQGYDGTRRGFAADHGCEEAELGSNAIRSVGKPSGFAAGTPVHTRDGVRPIEDVAAGDWVLSQPHPTGERGYKRVVRTVRHEDAPICRVRFSAKRGGQWVDQQVLVTPDHPIHVTGYHNEGGFSGEYWDELDKPIGWRQADRLGSYQLVRLASGETMGAGRPQRIWRTRQPGAGWIEVNADSTTGHRVEVGGGSAAGDLRALVEADFAGADDFNDRNSSRALQDKWAYRCAVHDLEVEDLHTYFVGEHGVWVGDVTASVGATGAADSGAREAGENVVGRGASPAYEDGEPIQKGDAVVRSGVNPARVDDVLVGDPAGIVLEHADGRKTLLHAPDAGVLVLVERRSPDFRRAALEWLSRRAETGDAVSQFALGNACQGGIGVPADSARAATWFTKAAMQGDAESQASLGWMYANGDGVPRDDAKSLEWFRKAAEQGEPTAQYALGCRYEQGRGVAVDFAQAVRWYRASADQGIGPAICNLADKYEHGKGVEKDMKIAFALYREAAEQGVVEARRWLEDAARRGLRG